jgi:hypothetical protein
MVEIFVLDSGINDNWEMSEIIFMAVRSGT